MLQQLLLLGALAGFSCAKLVEYDFDIGWVNRAPDGYQRPVIGINGQWPLPIIEVNKGDRLSVRVKNSLGNESTSLHFHGMYQNGSAAYDGSVGVTQCPIYPDDEFTYLFEANPAGTFWYHSHAKGQFPDGQRGMMIVHDPEWEDSLDVAEQVYFSFSDWYHTEQPFLTNQYLGVENTYGDLPSPDTSLFNDTRTPAPIVFEPGKRYLFRMVSVSALACTLFHIDGHVMTVVGADGMHVQPQNTTTLLVCPGQRYDVVVQAKSNPTSSFRFIAKMATAMFTQDIPEDDALTVIGSILYTFDGKTLDFHCDSLTSSWMPRGVFNDFTMKPLNNTPLLSPPDRTINLRTNQTYYQGIGTRVGIGRQPWTLAQVPSLFTAMSTGDAAFNESTYGPGVDPYIVRSGEIVQIYMENPQPWPHPMHLHGHEFQIAARGIGTWDHNETALPAVPAMRDTVIIPPDGYLVLRFRADNPGAWLFHCHIDLHLIGGMASTIIEAPDVLQATQSIPGHALNVCNNAPGWYGTGNCAGGKGLVGGPECDCDAGDQCNTIFNSGGDGDMGALVAGHEEVGVGDGVGESGAEKYGLQANPQKAEKRMKKNKVSRRKCECGSGKKEGRE